MQPLNRSQSQVSVTVMRVVVAFLVTVATQPVIAQNQTDIDSLDLDHLLDNIVTSVSKRDETLDEAPGSVFLITREMMDRYGFETVADALAIVPGLYVTKDFTSSSIGVRGISLFGDWNSRVILLIDGRSSVELYGGTSKIDLPGVSIDNLERIEVVKGPGSSLYGSNALFGTINFITRKQLKNSAQVTSVVSSATRTGQLSTAFAHHWNPDFSINGTFSVEGRDGSKLYFPEFSALDSTTLSLDEWGINQFYLDSAAYTAGYSDRKNKFKSASGHVVLRRGYWSLTGQYLSGQTGVAQSMWGSLFNRRENRFLETRGYVDLEYDAPVSAKAGLTARLSYDTYEFIDHVLYNHYILDASPAYLPGPLWIDVERDGWWSSEIRLDWRPSEKTRLMFGTDRKSHHLHQESGEADGGFETISSTASSAKSMSFRERVVTAYAQLDQQFGRTLRFTGALQINHQTFTSNAVIPKGAIVYSPSRGTSIKFIASRGYRTPTVYELTFDDGWFYIGNPDLTSETNSNYELVVSRALSYGFEVTASGFLSSLDGLITQTPIDSTDPSYPTYGSYDEVVSQYRNAGHLHTRGIELSVQRNPIYRLSGFVSGSYAHLQAISLSAQSAIPNSVARLFSAGLSYQVTPRKLSVSAVAKYVGPKMLWDGSRLSSSTLVDISIGYRRAIRGVNLNVGVTNLFDVNCRVPLSQDYAPSTTIGQPGRSVFVRLGVSK